MVLKFPDLREDNGRYTLYAFIYLFSLCAFWIFHASQSGLDLAPDEAYYWDWSRNLDWGYYEKPPLIAWTLALVTAIGGSTTFSIRTANALITMGTLAGMFLLAKTIFNGRIGFWALLIATLSPGMAAAAFIFTIDTPLMFFWAWGCFFGYLAVARNTWFLWVLSGILIGAACLAKQVAMAFPFLLIFSLLLSPTHRGRLRSPKLWISVVISYSMLLPPLLWNYAHDWITFTHTAHHVEIDPAHIFRPHLFFEYLGAQAGLLGPVLFLLIFITLWSHLKKRSSFLHFPTAYLLLLSYPALLGFHFISLFSRVHPNWPDTFYITAYPLTVAWALGTNGEENSPTKRRKKWLVAGVCVSAVFTVLVYLSALPAAPGIFLNPKMNPALRLAGWSELGEKAGAAARDIEREHGLKPETSFYFSNDRDYVCELAFYLPGQPEVFIWPPSPKLDSYYHFLGGLERRYGQNGIFVTRGGSPLPSNLTACFERVEQFRTLKLEVRDGVVKTHDIYLCSNLKELPPYYLKLQSAGKLR